MCLSAGGALVGLGAAHTSYPLGACWLLTSLHFKAWAPYVHFSDVLTLQVSRPSESFDSVLHSAALREGSLRLSKVRG